MEVAIFDFNLILFYYIKWKVLLLKHKLRPALTEETRVNHSHLMDFLEVMHWRTPAGFLTKTQTLPNDGKNTRPKQKSIENGQEDWEGRKDCEESDMIWSDRIVRDMRGRTVAPTLLWHCCILIGSKDIFLAQTRTESRRHDTGYSISGRHCFLHLLVPAPSGFPFSFAFRRHYYIYIYTLRERRRNEDLGLCFPFGFCSHWIGERCRRRMVVGMEEESCMCWRWTTAPSTGSS